MRVFLIAIVFGLVAAITAPVGLSRSSVDFGVQDAAATELGCVRSMGFYKTHPDDPVWSVAFAGGYNQQYFFPIFDHLTVGQVLKEPPRGDKLLIAAKQHLTAGLNFTSGASFSTEVIDAQFDVIFALITASFGETVDYAALENAKDTLDDYNNGRLGVPSCN